MLKMIIDRAGTVVKSTVKLRSYRFDVKLRSFVSFLGALY